MLPPAKLCGAWPNPEETSKMSQNTTEKTPNWVTKFIRLRPEEADELAHLVENTAYSEAALMRQWVLVGMERFRVSEAIRAYQEAEVDLRGAAERAGLPVAVLLEEMVARKVAVLDDPEDFGSSLEALRQTWPKDE